MPVWNDGEQSHPVPAERSTASGYDDDLRTQIGSTLRRRRELHRLTQTQFAQQAGVSQATVARIEKGDRAPSVDLLERLFATLGCQVRLQLEPLGRQVDEAIAALAELPIGKRIAESGIPPLAVDLEPIPYVFRGATAALLQGAPVPVDAIEIALAWRDCDAFVTWLEGRWGNRWHRHYQVPLPEVEIDAATPAAALLRRHRQLRAA